MPRNDYVSLQRVPDTGNAELNKFLAAMKENVELLCALRGAVSNHAVTKGTVTTDYPDTDGDLASLRETLRNVMVNLKT